MSHTLNNTELEVVRSGGAIERDHLRERGLATVEYAIGIVLVITVVGVLIWSAQQGFFKEAVESLFRAIFQIITQALNAKP